MIVTVKIKLMASVEQASSLLETIESMNRGCNEASRLAYNEQLFDRVSIHHLSYYLLREKFKLKSQMAIRCIGKVADAYKVRASKAKENIDTVRTFKLRGSVPFDDRIRMLTFDIQNEKMRILTLSGREKMSFQVGDNAKATLQCHKGESDLFFQNGSFYLNVCCEVPEAEPIETEGVLGVDLGICQLATTSDGVSFAGRQVEEVHKKRQAQRSGLQRKGTRSAKRKLKKVSGKEKRHKRDQNHVISKKIVYEAKRTGSSIALEDLSGICKRQRVSKTQRARFSGWAFAQLRFFIYYKAKLAGVPVLFVPPAYTSQRCYDCGHIEKGNRRSQSNFRCRKCGHKDHADKNASRNIGISHYWAVVNQPKVALSDSSDSSGKPSPLRQRYIDLSTQNTLFIFALANVRDAYCCKSTKRLFLGSPACC